MGSTNKKRVTFANDGISIDTTAATDQQPQASLARRKASATRANQSAARLLTLITLIPALLFAALSYGTIFSYLRQNDAAPTDEHGYVSIKVSADEKKLIEAHRKELRSLTLSSVEDNNARSSRRLEDGAKTKEEIQRELARQLMEKGASLRRAKKQMREIVELEGGNNEGASPYDKKDQQHTKQVATGTDSKSTKSGNDVDPEWAKSKMKLIARNFVR